MVEPPATPQDGSASGRADEPPPGDPPAARPPGLGSHDLYRALLDSMTEGVSLADEAGVILYTNPAEDALFGYAPGELLGRHVSVQNAYPDEENRRRVDEVIAHLKAHGTWEGEWLNRRKDGSIFITSSRISAVSVEGRQHWLCVQRDVTAVRAAELERQAADERLRESEERLRLAAHAAEIGTWDLDLVAGLGRWDEAALRIGGLLADGDATYDNDTWLRLVHPDDRERAAAAFRASLEPGGPAYHVEFRCSQPAEDGGLRWVTSHGAVLRDPGTGAPVRAVGILRDDTARRRDLERLSESEARLRTITNALPAMVWFATPDGEVHYFNDRWYDYTGQTAEQAIPNGWIEALHPDDAPVTAVQWAEAIATGQGYENECRYRDREGGYRWYVARATPLRGPDGAITGWFGTSIDIDARKRAELALRESEARFRSVFDSKLTGLALFDTVTGATIAINDTFLAMTGYSRAEFDAGLWDWRDLTLPEQLHLDETAIAQARVRGYWDTYEKDYRLRDGRRFPVRISSAPMPGHDGWVVVSVQDISQARAAEAELRESQKRLQLAQQAAGFGVWDWDLTANTISWSPEMYDLLDIDPATPPDGLFAAWATAVHPDDRERAEAVAMSGARTGEPFLMDFRVIRRGGELRWLRSQAAAVLDAEGRPVRLTGINLDVTAQHKVEEELRGEASKLAAAVEETTRERNRVFELSSDLFAAAGFDGYLKTINPAWEKLLGYSEAELLARPFIEFIHPDDHAAAAEIVTAMIQGQTVHEFEDRLVRRDGKAVWIAWTAVPEGERFYAVGRDVTREREREEALRQSQKMEAMGQLTGGVAHDFNNLLTPIVGALDMLQRKGLGGEREQRLISGAAQSADRAKTLVQRLLAFARRQPLQPVPVDVSQLARGMADLISSTTGPQIKVVVDAPDGLPPAKADPNQLEMAVLNLAVNARDAMPEGGTLRISLEAATVGRQHRSKLKPGRYLHLSVADTGIGMDAATRERAVEPFFSTKGIGKGTGLGLSMVHGLASQLGGALTISSTPGVGTNVELWLPQGEAPAAPAETAPQDSAALAGRGTVLLVDDEDLVRLSTADMLIELGYAVIEAGSAEEALRLLNRGPNPDIIVTDHLMPGMSGTDLAQQLRAERPWIKVLIVSGYAEIAGIVPDLPRLTKPFRSADLAASLAALSSTDPA